jgi:hypothetical protein
MERSSESVVQTAAPQRVWVGRVVLFLAVVALGFEQSPANEALRTALGLEVLDRTQNEWAVGATVFGLTCLIEGISSVLIIMGLHGPSGMVERITTRFRTAASEDDSTAANQSSRMARAGGVLTDASLALGVGAGLVVIRHHLRHATRPVSADLGTGAVATTVVAGVSGAIGVLAAGGIRHAARVGLETPAQWFVDYATDWRFWLVVFAAIQVASAVRRLLNRSKGEQP